MYHSVTAMVGAGVSAATSSRQCNICCLRHSNSINIMLWSCSRQQQPGMTQLGCFPPGAVQSQILLGVSMRSRILKGNRISVKRLFQAFQTSYCYCYRQTHLHPDSRWYSPTSWHAAGTALTSIVACCSALFCDRCWDCQQHLRT